MRRPMLDRLICPPVLACSAFLMLPFSAAAAGSAAPATTTQPQVRADLVMVRTNIAVTPAARDALDAQAGVVETAWMSRLVPGLRCVRVAPGGAAAAIATFAADPDVLYAVPDYIRHASSQTVAYGVTLVDAPLEWPTSRGAGAVVADLDTGVDLGHPDLPAPTLTQSFIPGVTSVQDGHGHGTHTAGIILALDNSIGVVGVAPSATFIAGKVLDDTGSGDDAGVAAGIDWAVASGARVISMSLGGPDDTPALHDSCDAALAAGVLVVAAAGNSASSAPSYPAAYSSVLSVSALDSTMTFASFSNFGSNISLAAPGVNVLSTFIGANATWNSTAHSGQTLTGSATGSVSGNAVYCGLGDSTGAFPPSVAGQIAHIRRGSISFQQKVANAQAAGAVGVIISNNVAGSFSGTLNTTVTIPVIGIAQADGDALQASDGISTSVCTACDHTYATLSGTSMACPHVSGVAALIFSAFPSATPAQVRTSLEQSALDLGTPGRDDYYGWGLVRADLAVQYFKANFACRADFNHSGSVTVQDIFDFLSAWFAAAPSADFNSSGAITVQDIFDFLSAWFAGCH